MIPPVELRVEKVAFGGEGIAHYEGKVVFIEAALPGERVLAQITEEKKNFSRAKIVRVLEPSVHRQVPPCPYVDHCGGCQYQHVDYSEELRLKQTQLTEILSSVPGLDASKIRTILPSDRHYGYRNGLTLHTIQAKKKGVKVLGFIGKDNVSRIPVEKCLLADDRLNAAFVQKYTFKQPAEKISIKLSQGGQIISDLDERYFRVSLSGESILASSRGFFQNNLFVAARMAERISSWMGSFCPEQFFDLYAGVGTFAFLCAARCPRIFAIEENPANVEALKMNRSERCLDSRMEIVAGRVEKAFPALWERAGSASSVLLLDPPRQGMSADLAQYLSSPPGHAPCLVYVSCDPATLARDLKSILSKEAYRVEEVAPFDMFPRTYHMEAAVLLLPKK